MRPLNWGPKPFLQSSACWFLSLFLHLALRFLNQTLETGGEGGRGETRVSQEPPPPPPQPFASSRGNSRPCPYIHTHTHTYIYSSKRVRTYTYTGLPPRPGNPALGRGSDVLPGLPSIPRAPGPLGFSKADPWLCHSPHKPPRTPLHHSRCSNSRQRPTLPSSLFFFFFPPFLSLFSPLLLSWLIPHWSHPGEIQKCKSEGKTPGNPRNFKAMFPITGKEGEASN